MHLTGTNLWMWLRYILYEEVETVKEIRHVQHANLSKGKPIININLNTHQFNSASAHHHEVHEEACKGVLCIFNGYNEFMYTCVVEYSLICAGVAFVFWANLERLKREQVFFDNFY